jgi:hypothetical protein
MLLLVTALQMEQVAPDAVGSTFMALDKSCIMTTSSWLLLLLLLLCLSAHGAGCA